jgi:hypothetical protein
VTFLQHPPGHIMVGCKDRANSLAVMLAFMLAFIDLPYVQP